MESLQNLCVNTLVKKGFPGLLSEKLPCFLYHLVVEKIRDANKPLWQKNIHLVHLDLLIKTNRMIIDVITKYGYLMFVYYYKRDIGDCIYYDYFSLTKWNTIDDDDIFFYNSTIEYFKIKGEYEKIERELKDALSPYEGN